MAKHASNPAGVEQQVTASDLVRHFGIWQDRATRAPVYILHRGRPRLVLTSLDVMDALCAPHTARPVNGSHLKTLLEAVGDMIILLGQDNNVVGASRGARGYFGEMVDNGAPLAGLCAVGDEALHAAVLRVTGSGLPETIECRSPRFPDRLLAFSINSGPSGCVLQVQDATALEELQHWRDRHESIFRAVEAAGGAAAIVNLRGRIDYASHRVTVLTGATVEALTAARIVSLVAVGDRSKLGDAFEAAIDQRSPQSLEASLLVGGAALRRVAIGLAPLLSAGHVVGVTVIINAAES
ncbi:MULTISPECIES: PAS domain-containing protein [unclassified Sphingomonas]|uniref:PAS domain-containing protein n=1 Tax=unclassified Sphingomonas TaxID=196159 RepID=UPI001D10C5C6|nr:MULTISPECIES: PAS domain-containing protein [unclassified Sphingomonas]MCC2979721.1 PAS domain-containing protein [Sphingomonas sp. IC4-52]MCD2315049.1 PAS domain-containing protein [Sphingomonas sp. IC-11]